MTNYGWTELIANGLIELCDVEEEETLMIAMYVDDLKRAQREER
jgi:DNA-directed RNA polymerase II subunit RPB2